MKLDALGNCKDPTVSIIIPCHNHSDYVMSAIDSAAEQTYKNIIISITDDGSTDDSYKKILSNVDEILEEETNDVIRAKCKYKNRIIYISRFDECKKQAFARNHCIKTVWKDSDLFMPLDADDLLFKDKVKKSVEVYLQMPKYIGLVYSDVIIFDKRNKVKRREYRPPYDRQLLERQNIISNSPLISRFALGYSGLYEEELPPCEDWDLWLRITENFVAIHIPEALQQYTTTGENCTFTVNSNRWNEQRSKVIGRMLERKKLRGENGST